MTDDAVSQADPGSAPDLLDAPRQFTIVDQRSSQRSEPANASENGGIEENASACCSSDEASRPVGKAKWIQQLEEIDERWNE